MWLFTSEVISNTYDRQRGCERLRQVATGRKRLRGTCPHAFAVRKYSLHSLLTEGEFFA